MAEPTTPQVLIRDALPEDAASIAALGADVFTITFGHSVSQKELSAFLSEHYSTDSIHADITNPLKSMIVAHLPRQTKIIGFALLTRGSTEPCLQHLSDTVELQRLYVDVGIHGKGVGKLLERRCVEMAREGGFGWMWLGVWEENLVALRVYEKFGFERVGEHDFVIGDVVQRDLIMCKKI
ncbi:hypothetical protein E2P81_ATG08893 [Venturia nashicola]|uniref:N-acetyltransferase domain-containing protein n=1 Tax=Venturia nashicola TaxID=86259 RepID=A0A4Z1P6G9_9PEZI|nr:hypothetical protein E6O75_ATG09090 [Venturia nashicola]TLD23549.1 hypothetical protein E2P81_ATG08893 [Venturia nashicola]